MHNLVIESYVTFNFFILNKQNLVFLEPIRAITSIGCSDNWFFVCVHQTLHMGWNLMVFKVTLPDKATGRIWEPWLSGPPQLVGEVLILIQIMVIDGQGCENAYPSPGLQKCRVSHLVNIWTVKDIPTWIPMVATNFVRSISLTPVLVPNCLNCFQDLVSPIHQLGRQSNCPY